MWQSKLFDIRVDLDSPSLALAYKRKMSSLDSDGGQDNARRRLAPQVSFKQDASYEGNSFKKPDHGAKRSGNRVN